VDTPLHVASSGSPPRHPLTRALARISRPLVSQLTAGVLIALFLIALLLPFGDLDPIRGVTASDSPFADEGANIVNARNLVLLGSWSTDDWNLHLLNGPFSLAEALVFSLLGVGIVHARLVSIMCVAATGALLAGGLTRWLGSLPGFVAALAYGTSALVLFYGRLAYVEPMAGLLLLIGLMTLAAIEGKHSALGGAAAGVAFAAAIATKALVAPATIAIYAVVALVALRQPTVRAWLLGAVAGLAVGGMVWAYLVWLPHRVDVINMVAHVLPRVSVVVGPRGLARAVSYFIGRGDDGTMMRSFPVLFAAALGGVTLLLWRELIPKPVRLLYAAGAVALAVALLSLAVVAYHPNRYVVPFLPLAAILAAPATVRLVSVAPSLVSLKTRTALMLALILALSAPGVAAYASWVANGTRTLPGVEDAARQLVPAGSVVAGHYSPLVILNARAIAIIPCCGADPVNGGDLYDENGARYIVTGANPPGWTPAPAARWAAAERLLCFTWGTVPAESCLYRLP
jgi:hypothetical protein